MKTDTQMDDVEEEREAPVPRKRERPPTRYLPSPFPKTIRPIAADAQGGPTITSSMPTPQGAGDEKVPEDPGARRPSTAVQLFEQRRGSRRGR